MIQTIDKRLSDELSGHTRSLSVKRFFQSMGYERSGELPLIVSRLEPDFHRPLRLLDIGSGDSVLPTFLLKKTAWDITCLDKFSWVQKQHEFARRVMDGRDYSSRFHVVEQDLLESDFPAESYDLITNISVIEHFDGMSDGEAMKRSAALLRPGGRYILTTLMNGARFREFFLNQNIYGEEFSGKSVFFQRHYDVPSFEERVLKPSGLHEMERIDFGDYGFQFAETFMDMPWPWKPVKALYQWATPVFARRFLTYRDYPFGNPAMRMFTASGVFVVLEKPPCVE